MVDACDAAQRAGMRFGIVDAGEDGQMKRLFGFEVVEDEAAEIGDDRVAGGMKLRSSRTRSAMYWKAWDSAAERSRSALLCSTRSTPLQRRSMKLYWPWMLRTATSK